MPTNEAVWTRVETEAEFREAFADRTFVGDGARFTIHTDGRLTGEIGDSALMGTWYWREGLFCRTATLDGQDLGLDCEVIEKQPGRMRYTRDGGCGASTIVMVV